MIISLFKVFIFQKIGYAFTLEISDFGNVKMLAEKFPVSFSKNRFYFIGGENIILSLNPVTVSVLPTEKPSVIM